MDVPHPEPATQILKLKREALIRALEATHGNRTHAARDLGVGIRTVRNWITRFGLATRFPASYGVGGLGYRTKGKKP
jgi:transcriptional regulator with GAF, ATPase, and Fis domain